MPKINQNGPTDASPEAPAVVTDATGEDFDPRPVDSETEENEGSDESSLGQNSSPSTSKTQTTRGRNANRR